MPTPKPTRVTADVLCRKDAGVISEVELAAARAQSAAASRKMHRCTNARRVSYAKSQAVVVVSDCVRGGGP